MAADVQIALQPQAGQDPAAAVAAAASRLVRLSLEMLAQQVGQSLAGKVLAAPPNFPAALTQIAVADQIVTLKLSSPLPAGTPVRIDVQQPATGAPTVSVQPHPPVQSNAPAQAPIRAPLPVVQMATPTVQAFAPPAPPPPTTAVSASPTPHVAAAPAPTSVAAPPPAAPASQALSQTSLAPTSPEQRPAAPSAQPAPTVATAANAPPQPPVQTGRPQASVQQPSAPSASPTPAPAAPTAQPSVGVLPSPSNPAPTTVATLLPATTPAAVVAAGPPSQSVSAPPSQAPAAPIPTAAPPTSPAAPLVQTQTLAAAPAVAATTPPSIPAPAATATPTPIAMPTPAPAATPPVLMQRLTQAFAPLAPVAAPPASGSPAQLAAAVTTQAAAQQQSPAPLLQSLAVRLPQLPPAVAEAATRLLSSRINLDRGAPSAAALKQAVLQSGVFLDAPAKAGTPPDTRQALLGLRSALLGWLGGEVEPVPPADRRPPPPARGDMPRAQMPEVPPPATEGSAKEAGKTILSQTEGALSRIKLMQLTSQPTDNSRLGTPLPGPSEWNLELPMMIGRELTMAQIQINRDGKGKAEAKDKHWRLRFALKFSVLGEVGAQVSMLGSKTSVALWADEALTADTLEDMLPELAPAFAARGLELVSLSVRRGAPRDEARPAGRLMDSLR